jgi:radical SAM superfamily enzyme YgiQ (UPF0313 family)
MTTPDVTLINFNLMYATVDGSLDFQMYPPLGLLHIISALEQKHISVELRDYQRVARDHPDGALELDRFEAFAEGAADIVGFSCMANLLPFALLAARRLKERHPEKRIILGGVGPTGVARQIMERFPWIDHVVFGEGELTVVELVRALLRRDVCEDHGGPVVPGSLVRRKGDVLFSPRSRITDLDALPLPAYHRMDATAYDAAFSVVTSRGCPFSCAFCTETNHWGNQTVFLGIERVIEEIRQTQRYSAKNVFLFQDDQITLNRPRAVKLFQRLIQEYSGMLWKAFVRVDQVDEELLELMAAAGCIQVRFGVESGSNRVLREIRKGFTIEQAYAAVRLALKHIPSVHASFIWGFPFETLDECRETVAWAERLQEEGCTVLSFLLSPLPNSEIFRNYRGRLDFNTDIMSNFNCSGAEDIQQKRTRPLRRAQYLFQFIQQHPDIFPGFYLYDLKGNIGPKSRIIRKKRSLVFRGLKRMVIKGYRDVDL